MRKIISFFISSIIITSCSLPTHTNNISDFKLKNFEENDLGATFIPNSDIWESFYPVLDDTEEAVKRNTVMDNLSTRFEYIGNNETNSQWVNSNLNSPMGGNFQFNPGKPYMPDSSFENKYLSNNSDIKYYSGAISWFNYINGYQNYDYTHAIPLVIENTSTGEDHSPKYWYNNNTQYQEWSSSMPDIWQTYDTYTYNRCSGRKITFEFRGTNVHIRQLKGPTRGISDIKIYKANDNVLVTSATNDLYSTSWGEKITSFKALKGERYRAEISFNSVSPNAPDPNNCMSYGLFDFDWAKVYPSIEYTFNGTNIAYKALKNFDHSKVDITPNGDTSKTVEVDLYNPYVQFEYVKGLQFDNTIENNRITIEGKYEKNPSSTGYKFSLDNFGVVPYFEFSTDSNKNYEKYMNFILPIGPNNGILDLYYESFNNSGYRYIKQAAFNTTYSWSDFSKFTINLTNTNYELGKKVRLVPRYSDALSKTGIGVDAIGLGDHTGEFRFKVDPTASTTTVKVRSVKADNYGKLDVYLDSTNKGTMDLYKSEVVTFPREFSELTITNISPGNHTLYLKPKFEKNLNSKGYTVNIDSIVLDKADSVCDP